MPFVSQKYIGYFLYFLICSFAIICGKRNERYVSIALIAQLALTFFVQNHHDMQNLQINILIIDVFLFFILLILALRSNAFWILFATAFQFLAIATHVAKLIDPSVHGWAYLTAGMIWGYGVIASLLVGTLQALANRSSPANVVLSPTEPASRRRGD